MISQSVIFTIIASIIVVIALIFGTWYIIRAVRANRQTQEELQTLTSEINLPVIN